MSERDLSSSIKPGPPKTRLGRLRMELTGVLVFLMTIWIVFLIARFLPLNEYGLQPRTLPGLAGIFTMTFLHRDFGHLLSNSFPLLVLLVLLAGSRARTWRIVSLIVLLGAICLWVVGRAQNHIGASLLIFGLISYLVSTGLYFQKRLIPLLIALVTAFFYGIPLLQGILPWGARQHTVSWDGHLCGALAGVLVGYLMTRGGQSTLQRISHGHISRGSLMKKV